jgi:hypothetical protein
LGTGSMLGRSLVGGGLGMQRRGSRHQICRCLGDNCQSSAQTAPVGSRQLRLGKHSVECGLVGCSRAWWNDRQNDQLSKRRGCPTARTDARKAGRALRPAGQANGRDMVRSWPLRTSGQPRRQGAHEGICASDVGGLPLRLASMQVYSDR